MNAHHHPDPSTLLAYSAGALSEAFAAVVAAHLELCRHCSAEVRHGERIGGRLIEQQQGAPLPDGARAAMLQRIQVQPPLPAVVPTPRRLPGADELPRALHRYFGPRYSALRWRMLGPGVHHIRASGADGQLMLIRTAPGRSLPMHTHGGSELTLILQGAYDDRLGHFAPGDVADLDSEVEHQPVTAPGIPCICVAAVDAPLRFSGWLARTLQPLFKL